MQAANHTIRPMPGRSAMRRRIPKPAKNAPRRARFVVPFTQIRPITSAVVTYPSGASRLSADSIPSPRGMPTMVTSTSAPAKGPTMPTSAPQPMEPPTFLPAAAAVSAARGKSPTNTKPKTAIEIVTASHSRARKPMMSPVKMPLRSTRFTWPATVPRAIRGSSRDTTSPPT
jgi:hypothetical protein